jgi:hypothetical protein
MLSRNCIQFSPKPRRRDRRLVVQRKIAQLIRRQMRARAIQQGASSADRAGCPPVGRFGPAIGGPGGCRQLRSKRGRPIGVGSSMIAEPPRRRIWRSCPSTLADVIARIDTVAIACSKCDRTAQYPVATLIERYGPQFAVDDLLRLLSVGCPMRESTGPCAACGIYMVRRSTSDDL